mmetsp:Transcript_19307/g.68233  ORF Transcript_19307/g.68233 Transcript_19307/m.68233 type:complete len:223 (-) Transcript_19307:767-1435(-)
MTSAGRSVLTSTSWLAAATAVMSGLSPCSAASSRDAANLSAAGGSRIRTTATLYASQPRSSPSSRSSPASPAPPAAAGTWGPVGAGGCSAAAYARTARAPNAVVSALYAVAHSSSPKSTGSAPSPVGHSARALSARSVLTSFRMRLGTSPRSAVHSGRNTTTRSGDSSHLRPSSEASSTSSGLAGHVCGCSGRQRNSGSSLASLVLSHNPVTVPATRLIEPV